MKAETFWQYSLSRYSIDEVKNACMRLQDSYGYNVNLLLFCMHCDSLAVLLCQQSIADIKSKMVLSDQQLIAHRNQRRMAKVETVVKAAQEQSNIYESLLKQELALEAQQQEIIVAAFLLINEKLYVGSALAQSASLLSYLNQQSDNIDHEQQQLIEVLRKHV